MSSRIVAILVAFPLCAASLPASSQETCGVAVTSCRNELFAVGDIAAADDACAAAVAGSPNDGCARILRGATRILRVFGENVNGPDPGTFTDSVKEMMDRFGVTPGGRDLYAFSASLPHDLEDEIDLPANSPDGSDVQEAASGLLLPAIDASITDLQAVPANTVLVLQQSELEVIGTATAVRALLGLEIEVDYGDAKLMEAALHLWRSQLLQSAALNTGIDLDSYTPILSPIPIQTSVVDAHPSLVTLLPGSGSALAEANVSNRAAIDAYLAASASIRSEVDDQTNDLFTIEPTQLVLESEFRMHLASLRSSLDGPTSVLNQGTSTIDEATILEALNTMLGTSFGSEGATLDLGLFYDVDPFDVRDVLPEFDAVNAVQDGSFPDPTFRGVLLPEPSLPGQLVAAVAALAMLRRRRGGRSR